MIPRPWWVKIGLLGLPNRMTALALVCLSIALAIALTVLWSFVGLLFGISALWYWWSIRWMDRKQQW
jgi:hypothetical protein